VSHDNLAPLGLQLFQGTGQVEHLLELRRGLVCQKLLESQGRMIHCFVNGLLRVNAPALAQSVSHGVLEDVAEDPMQPMFDRVGIMAAEVAPGFFGFEERFLHQVRAIHALAQFRDAPQETFCQHLQHGTHLQPGNFGRRTH
jgi:hypothetical protein